MQYTTRSVYIQIKYQINLTCRFLKKLPSNIRDLKYLDMIGDGAKLNAYQKSRIVLAYNCKISSNEFDSFYRAG